MAKHLGIAVSSGAALGRLAEDQTTSAGDL
jgi:hypothetical protein